MPQPVYSRCPMHIPKDQDHRHTALWILHTLFPPPHPHWYYLLTYSMEQSPSWESNWFAASQEIPRVLWNPKVPNRTHRRQRALVSAFNNSTFCPHSVFMCFVWIWEQTAIISLYSINWLGFVTVMECVYCAVRTGSLYKIQVNLGQKKSYRRKSLCCIWSVKDCICRGKPRTLELGHSNWRPVFTVTWSNVMRSSTVFKTGTIETSEGGHCIVSGAPPVTVCHLVYSLLKTSRKTRRSLLPSKEIPGISFT
jgi:hypothetical protein